MYPITSVVAFIPSLSLSRRSDCSGAQGLRPRYPTSAEVFSAVSRCIFARGKILNPVPWSSQITLLNPWLSIVPQAYSFFPMHPPKFFCPARRSDTVILTVDPVTPSVPVNRQTAQFYGMRMSFH